MMFFDFVALVLATGAILDVWFNGSILATPRALVQAYDDTPGTRLRLLWQLLNCDYCLSYHVPVYLMALTYFWPDLMLLVYALGATRASLLLNDFLPKQLRYQRDATLPEYSLEDDNDDGRSNTARAD